MYLTSVNYKDNNLNENKIVTTLENFDQLNIKFNCQNDELNI